MTGISLCNETQSNGRSHKSLIIVPVRQAHSKEDKCLFWST